MTPVTYKIPAALHFPKGEEIHLFGLTSLRSSLPLKIRGGKGEL